MYWRHLNRSNLGVDQQKQIGAIFYLKKLRTALARVFYKLRFSVSASTIWQALDKTLMNKIVSIQNRDKQEVEESFATKGP